MIRSRVAERYARSILDLALEQNALSEVEQDMLTLQAAIRDSRDLRTFLDSPVVDAFRKEKILEQVFHERLSPLVARFVSLVARKGRAEELPNVVGLFFNLLDRHRHVTPAVVTTAVELDEAQRARIEKELERRSGGTIRAQYLVDPSLIGGFRARFHDTMIDASVRHQLERLRQTLTEG